PRPDVLERLLRAARPGGPAVPLLRHRALRRPVRPEGDRGDRGDVPRARGRDGRVPGWERPAGPPPARGTDEGLVGPGGVRTGGQAPRPALRRPAGTRIPGDGADAPPGYRRRRARRG